MSYPAPKWHVLSAVLLASIMGPIDASVVNITFPHLAAIFGVGEGLVGWVSMSYLLVLSSFLLSFGRLGDMFGFRRIFLTGNALFTLASFFCSLAWGIGPLVAFRAIQAMGAGMTMALAPAIITSVFPARERGRALGINGMIVALGLAMGPSLGGVLLDLWGWRAIFIINIPIGIAAHLVCYRLLPEKERLEKTHFDWPGSFLALACLASLLFFLSRGQDYGWSGLMVVPGGLALICGALFIRHERRASQPMLDLAIFRSHAFTAGNIAALFHFITQYIIVFVTPFYMQQQLGFSATKMGLVQTAFPLTVLVVAPISGALSDKIGNRFLSAAGAGLCALGAFSLSFAGPYFAAVDVAWRLSLLGLGTGMFQSPNNSAIMGSADPGRLGIAGGVLATFRNVGMVLGIAAAGAVLAAREGVYLSQSSPISRLLAMQDAYTVAALMSVICLAACLAVRAGQPSAKMVE